MEKQLPQCFLGKNVFLEEKKSYTIKYQDNRNKDGVHVLLFEDEKPVIFAVMKKDGSFKDAFFINKKTNPSSVVAINRYNKMLERKAKLQATQDDLKDALRNIDEAKMKNANIYKLLVDEHLEDIKNGWSSRLLYLQMTEFKTEDSLIISSLKEALSKANPHKAFYYLTLHRRDELLPELINHLSSNHDLIEIISEYYLTNKADKYLLSFLKEAAKTLPLNEIEIIREILSQAYTTDLKYKTSFFKPVFLLFYKRTKTEPTIETKEWLHSLSINPILNKAIRSISKAK